MNTLALLVTTTMEIYRHFYRAVSSPKRNSWVNEWKLKVTEPWRANEKNRQLGVEKPCIPEHLVESALLGSPSPRKADILPSLLHER